MSIEYRALIIFSLRICCSSSYTYIDGAAFEQSYAIQGLEPGVVHQGTSEIRTWESTVPECFDLDGDGDHDCMVADDVTSLP